MESVRGTRAILEQDNRTLNQLADFGGEDKVAFRKAVDAVRPDLDLRVAPGKINIGMMVLFLGEFADLVDEIKRFAEIRKLEFTFQIFFVEDPPFSPELVLHMFQCIAFERRSLAVAGLALLFRKI